MYDVRAIANWFLDRAQQDGERLTAMKLQKLAYVSHGWYLAFNDEPLIHEAVEAWKWGPVFRTLYREFRDDGSNPIDCRAIVFDGADLEDKKITIEDYDESPEQMSEFLESVWNVYGKYSAGELSDITHQAGTPWRKMYEEMGKMIRPFTVIPNNLIQEHYKKLLDERTATSNTAS